MSIIVQDLTKKFNTYIAVDNISFQVKKGEIFAFLGPNGAGKSTTIKMLTTLLQPNSGTININGMDILNNAHMVRKSFGIVFQDPSLDDELTAYENMNFHGMLYQVPISVRYPRIEELLKFVDLWDRKGDIVKNFSGGMKRRLEIARALLHHPQIIFLDEPTVGLDPQTRNHIWSYLRDLNQQENITIFFTTHYMDEAEKIAHKIAIIDYGKIIIQGTLEELKIKSQQTNLDDIFLALTGKGIRGESSTSLDHMRTARKQWRR